jgi:hypothetical protein
VLETTVPAAQMDAQTVDARYRDPPGASPEPVRVGHPPEPSVAGAADKATSLARWKSSRRQLLDSDG